MVGMIFGFLALLLPGPMLGAFYGFFWLLVILGIGLFVFLAITGKGDESMLWFGIAAVLLVVGVISFLYSGFVAILFILIIAAVAIYNGFTDITLALTHPKTKYILIPGMILTGFALLGILFYYFPGFEENLVLSVMGTFALVFGAFSVLLGFYHPEGEGSEKTSRATACTTHKYGGRK
jgi:hypothetical protein